jgi:hypothetical protein
VGVVKAAAGGVDTLADAELAEQRIRSEQQYRGEQQYH